ncbi:MAG TPA: VOC family protein [Thermoanaerobaculia bacterium]|nr:VOC family protein [Thermoanaerobaculia bacterium]
MPDPPLRSLDHLVIRVRDLDAATATYRALLGRAPSWRGEHPQWGTSNVLFRLENTYVELLGVPQSAPDTGPFAIPPGEPPEGASMLAFGTADAEAFRRHAEERGLRPSAVQPGRGVDLDTGAVRAWANVFLPRTATHGARIFVIEHRSPAAALPPARPEHGDETATAHAVDHVVVRTRDGDRARTLYGDALGIRLALDRRFPEWGARLLFFRLGHLTVELAAPLEPPADPPADDHFWGVSYRVRDAVAARARLLAAGIATSEVRAGRKPGTRVLTVEGEPCGVPTLLLEPAAD